MNKDYQKLKYFSMGENFLVTAFVTDGHFDIWRVLAAIEYSYIICKLLHQYFTCPNLLKQLLYFG